MRCLRCLLAYGHDEDCRRGMSDAEIITGRIHEERRRSDRCEEVPTFKHRWD
ncbi:hypothetical protein [Tolypothrix sp. VBCCA 56010]|uniref:hypothetical protein n=1 Tax=Tolypothrix sp. VBCCA 56010 TaxID=3137731 RepID=UPI003D7DEBB7